MSEHQDPNQGTEMVQLNLEVPRDQKEQAKERLPYGGLSAELRRLIANIAESGAGKSSEIDTSNYYEELEKKERPSDWDNRREEAFLRDDYRCRNCSKRGGRDGPATLCAHHIVPVDNGGNHYISNLVTLCHECHSRTHGGVF